MPSILQRAVEYSHSSDRRMTEQRRLIIEIVEHSANKPVAEALDADRLYTLAHAKDKKISLATVYRTINFLEEAGLVRQHYFNEEHDRKVITITDDHKHVFTCQECGARIAFSLPLLEEASRQIETLLSVEVDHLCICVSGLCPKCMAEDKPACELITLTPINQQPAK